MRWPRAPLYNPPPHQGLSSLADTPPRYNTAPTPPASTSYDPPPIQGQDRDDTFAK